MEGNRETTKPEPATFRQLLCLKKGESITVWRVISTNLISVLKYTNPVRRLRPGKVRLGRFF